MKVTRKFMRSQRYRLLRALRFFESVEGAVISISNWKELKKRAHGNWPTWVIE